MRGSDLDGVLPDKAAMAVAQLNQPDEQPTLFYAVALVLALAAVGGKRFVSRLGLRGLRVIHSLVQRQATTSASAFRLGFGIAGCCSF